MMSLSIKNIFPLLTEARWDTTGERGNHVAADRLGKEVQLK